MKKCLFFLFSLLMSGCNPFDNTISYTVDNPKDKPITITLDDKKYNISANSSILVSLSPGIHSISYRDETLNFYLSENNKGGLINPTLSNYYVNYAIYNPSTGGCCWNEMAKKMLQHYRNTEVVLRDELTGYFKKYDGLIIEKQSEEKAWQVGLDKDYASAIQTTSAVQVIGKLFREKEFIRYIKNQYGTVLSSESEYQPTERHYADINLVYPPLTLKTSCVSINYYINQLNRQLESLQSLKTDQAEREAMKKQLYYYSVEFEKAKQLCPERNIYSDENWSTRTDKHIVSLSERRVNQALEDIHNRGVYILK